MSQDAAPRVVLVTGGAARLGRAIVQHLAARGWWVIFTAHTSKQRAEELSAQLTSHGLAVQALWADLRDPEAWPWLVHTIADRYGRLDALVNNAAVFPRTALETLELPTWAAVMRVNLEAAVFLVLTAANLLRAAGGSVVNLLDIHGRYPVRSYLPYCISKAALEGATRALAVELAPEVRVNGVAPGIALFPDGTPEDARRRQLARTLLGREGGAEEIARAVAFLIEDAKTMTGQILTFDGGRTVHLKE